MITESQNGDLFLKLDRCPHCLKANPILNALKLHNDIRIEWERYTIAKAHHHLENISHLIWGFYCCTFCGGFITTCSEVSSELNADDNIRDIKAIFPSGDLKPMDNFPKEAKHYLRQAEESLSQPDGAIMLTASAVDAMLKEKKCIGDKLYPKINYAYENNIITEDMKKWADNIRLDSNNSRHTDKKTHLPSIEDAERCFTFALTLGEILFTLPARVSKGVKEAKNPSQPDQKENDSSSETTKSASS